MAEASNGLQFMGCTAYGNFLAGGQDGLQDHAAARQAARDRFPGTEAAWRANHGLEARQRLEAMGLEMERGFVYGAGLQAVPPLRAGASEQERWEREFLEHAADYATWCRAQAKSATIRAGVFLGLLATGFLVVCRLAYLAG